MCVSGVKSHQLCLLGYVLSQYVRHRRASYLAYQIFINYQYARSKLISSSIHKLPIRMDRRLNIRKLLRFFDMYRTNNVGHTLNWESDMLKTLNIE